MTRVRRIGGCILICVVSVVGLLAGLRLLFPPSLRVELPTRELPDGSRQVVVRAVRSSRVDDLVFQQNVRATINGGILTADVKFPSDVVKNSFYVELCANTNGDASENCFADSSSVDKGTKISCPLYATSSQTSWFGAILRRNVVSLGDSTGCASALADGESFGETSLLGAISEQAKYSSVTLATDGVVVSSGGKLSTMSMAEIAKQAGSEAVAWMPAASSTVTPAATKSTINNYTTNTYQSTNNTYQTVAANNQTLQLVGNNLSISQGNTIDLTPLVGTNGSGGSGVFPIADSTTDGLLSASDWNMFASKQNSLVFGGGLTSNGTNVSLTPCAANQVLKSIGSSWVCASDNVGAAGQTYTAGTGITIDSSNIISSVLGDSVGSSEIEPGSVTADKLASTGVISGTYGSGSSIPVLSVNAQGQVTAVSTTPISTASATSEGLLSGADWAKFNGKENVLTFSDGLVRSADAISLMQCGARQVLQRDATGSSWVCASQVVDTDTNTTYTAGTGLSLMGTTFANEGLLSLTTSGALTSSGGQNPAITLNSSTDLTQLGGQLSLSDTGVMPGTYNAVTVDGKGRVTTGTNVSYLTSENDGVIGNEVAGVINNGGLLMTGAGTSADPYRVGLITACSDGQLLKYTAAGGWACASDIDTNTPNTDNQTLTWDTTTNQLAISGGNTVDLSSLKDNTDAQTLSITDGSAGSHTVAISGGNSQVLTESQALSYDAATRTIALTNGGSVALPVDNNTTYTAGSGLAMSGTTLYLDCGATGTALCNGGNAYGAAATIGTNDNYGLRFETNNTTAMTLTSTGQLVLKNPTNSNMAFQVQDQAALPQFTIDTSSKQIKIGSATSDATAITLVLDSYNSTTDPAGTAGAMYYNSALGAFRCYGSQGWGTCYDGQAPAARVYSTVSTSLTSGVTTRIAFNTTAFNVGNGISVVQSGGATRLTATKAGIYQVTTTMAVNTNATSGRTLFVQKNGSAVSVVNTNATSSGGTHMNNSTLVELAVGDYITVAVQQTSGTTLATVAGAEYANFSMSRVSAP